MRKITILTAFILGTSSAFSQVVNVQVMFNLPNTLNESSGAIFFNDKIITHNDSGNENKLYELDTISGLVTRTVTVTNATNIDWEDIAQDETSIYIGDIGNNNGDRTNLKVYKINKSDYLSSTSVIAAIINFNYSDQVDFTPKPNNTEWDAEALISIDTNNLILFTKNWVNGTTKAYSIPKTSGTFSVNPLPTTLSSGGRITGATYNPVTKKIYSVGYNPTLQPFIWVCENFTNDDVFSGTNTQTFLSSLGFEQAEAITYIDYNRYFITSESFSFGPISDKAKLVSFTTADDILSVNELPNYPVNLYPNPVNEVLNIDSPEFTSIEIYNSRSALVYRGYNENINVLKLSTGPYFVKVNFKNHGYTIKKIIKY